MQLPNPSTTTWMLLKANFLAEKWWSELRVFLVLDLLLYQDQITSQPYYLPIARGRTNGLMLFPRALSRKERQQVLPEFLLYA